MDWLGVIGSVLGGGATGLFGSAVTGYANFKMQKLKNEHDREMAKIQIDSIKVEAEANAKITETQTAGAVEIAESKAFEASIAAAQKDLFDSSYMVGLMASPWTRWIGALISFLFGLVDFLKAMARPALTYYLVGASTWITLLVWKVVQTTQNAFTATQAHDLFRVVVLTILSLTVTIVTWWFADRRMAKFLTKILN